MDHPLRLDAVDTARPWRLAVLALAGIAVVELVLLVIAGGALVAKPGGGPGERRAAAPARKTAPAKASAKRTPAAAKRRSASAVELPRRKVGLLVLNGNGRQGAAGAAAARATRRGYRITGVANAPSAEYPRSFVMFRPGFAPEARRLARDLGVRVVVPLDGMRPSQLQGAHAVLILGD